MNPPRIVNQPDTSDRHATFGFWFLNDHLQRHELTRQLQTFAEAGYAGVVIHPRDGMTTPYLSQAWFDAVRHIMETCVTLGLQAWFYDENPYPSGLLGGRLLDDDPGRVAMSLVPHRLQVRVESGVALNAVFRNLQGMVRIFARQIHHDSPEPWQDVTEHAGRVSDAWHLQAFREIGYGPAYRTTQANPQHWRGWTHHYRWHLHWPDAPPGDYELLAIGREPREDYRHGRFPDLLDTTVGERFVQGVYQRTFDALGQAMFRRFIAAFTDEPSLAGPVPWHRDLPDMYEQRYGEPLWPRLVELFDADDAQACALRRRYRDLVGRLWESAYTLPIKRWLAQHNIPLSGHISPEEDPSLATLRAPGLRRQVRHFDWPGYDLVTLPFGEAEDAKLIGPIWVKSVAHQHARAHLIVEMLGCCGEDLNIAMMRRATDWLAIHGYDRFVVHGQYYTLRHMRKREAPPSIFDQQPYWRHMAPLSTYQAALARWIESTTPQRDLAVVMPWSAFEAMRPDDVQRAHVLARRLAVLVGAMCRAGLDFDLLDDDLLAEAKLKDKTLHVGHAQYRSVIELQHPMCDPDVTERLEAWQRAGLWRRTLAEENDPFETVAQLITRHRHDVIVDADTDVRIAQRASHGKNERLIWNPNPHPIAIELDDATLTCDRLDEGLPLEVSRKAQRLHLTLPAYRTALLHHASTGTDATAEYFTPIDTAGMLSSWRVILPQSQSVTLRQWQCAHDDKPVTLPAPQPDDWINRACDVPIVLTCRLRLNSDMPFEAIAWETPEQFVAELILDGRRLQAEGTQHSAGVIETLFPIGDLTAGEHELQLRIICDDMRAVAAMDVPRLLGAFLVDDVTDGPGVTLRPMPGDGVMTMDRPQPWTQWGMPHYSGSVRYEATLRLSGDEPRLALTAAPNQRDAFEVQFDGGSLGHWLWPGDDVRLPAEPGAGEHRLAFVVSNTLANRFEARAVCSGLVDTPVLLAMAEGKGAR